MSGDCGCGGGAVRAVATMEKRLAAARADAMRKAAQSFSGDRSAAGRYAAEQRWKGHQKAEPSGGRRGAAMDESGQMRRPPADVIARTADEAWEALQQGKTVEIDEVSRTSTLIQELRDFAREAKEKGEDSTLNLCKVSVPGTNLFCGEALRDEEGNPIAREKMPQLGGIPKAGSPADDEKKFPKNADGGVDIGPAYEKHLIERGVATRELEVPAASLKASQSELKGSSVAYLMSEEGQAKSKEQGGTIYVSRDGYIIDGHHRWAAAVGLDTSDGNLGDIKIKVRVIDMPIQEVLKDATTFADVMGIERKKA